MGHKGRLCSYTNTKKIESMLECKAAMGQLRKFDSRLTWVGQRSGPSRGCSIIHVGSVYEVFWNPTNDFILDTNSHTICISECISV